MTDDSAHPGTIVRRLAREAGFAAVGIAPAAPLDADPVDRLERWVGSPRSGPLEYLRRNRALRHDPSGLLDGARGVICLAMSYAPPGPDASADLRVARYARRRDYHEALKTRARGVAEGLADALGPHGFRVFVDSAPLMERSLAVRAGLGWIGRNGCLLIPGIGSFVLLAEVVTTLALPVDAPVGGGCGSCRRCVEACPTRAVGPDGLLDVRRCLSHLNKGPGDVPEPLREAMGAWVYGCDICQEVCPHNRDAAAGDVELAGAWPPASGPPWTLRDCLGWTEHDYLFARRGAGIRLAYLPFLRNAAIAAGNSRRSDLADPLAALARRAPDLSEVVRWALGRLDR